MPTSLITARAKIYASIAVLKEIRRNLEDAVGRAELRKVIDTLERGQMQLDAAMLEQDEDRCTYCGAPPEKQRSPEDAWWTTDRCRTCGADIPQPPPENRSFTEPDISY